METKCYCEGCNKEKTATYREWLDYHFCDDCNERFWNEEGSEYLREMNDE